MSKGLAEAIIDYNATAHADLSSLRQADVRQSNMRQDVDRTFEMPSALYGATVGLYLGFIAILGIGLSTPELALPMAIFAIFIVGLFGAPALWLGLGRKPEARAKTLGELMRHGIATHTGLLKGKDAAIQMMILPVLIVVWAFTVLLIAGIVAA